MLDLHGASVAEAIRLTTRVVRASARRGRSSVKVVHGHSTSKPGVFTQTIKRALHDLVDAGTLDDVVVHSWRAEGHLLLSLDVTQPPNPARLRLADVT